MFSRYDNYLLSNFSSDYWSDEGISHAAHIVEGFSSEDWSMLRVKLMERASPWLIRCAETLGDIASKQSLDTLLKLLQVADNEVKIAALGSLNSIFSMNPELIREGAGLVSLAQEMQATASGLEKQMLDSLQIKFMNYD